MNKDSKVLLIVMPQLTLPRTTAPCLVFFGFQSLSRYMTCVSCVPCVPCAVCALCAVCVVCAVCDVRAVRAAVIRT